MDNTIIVHHRNRAFFAPLLEEHFKKRHDLFRKTLDWDVPSTDHIEMDQYDRSETVYVLVERDGNLAAYARLLCTNAEAQFGKHTFSYMAKDASAGLLPGIPTDILGGMPPPVSSQVWEMTRTEAVDLAALKLLFQQANLFLIGEGATSTIAFTRRNFAGILSKLGFPTTTIGPVVEYGGKPYCAMLTCLNKKQQKNLFPVRLAS